jgi:hypothetical protein
MHRHYPVLFHLRYLDLLIFSSQIFGGHFFSGSGTVENLIRFQTLLDPEKRHSLLKTNFFDKSPYDDQTSFDPLEIGCDQVVFFWVRLFSLPQLTHYTVAIFAFVTTIVSRVWIELVGRIAVLIKYFHPNTSR